MLRRLSQENFEVVDAEDADESDFADLPGGKHLEVLCAYIALRGCARQGDAVVQMHDFARPFPKGDVYWVARMEHCQCRCMVYRLCHKVESLWSKVERVQSEKNL